MSNMLMIGLLWKTLDLDLRILEAEVEKKFASKPALLKIDLACIRYAYERSEQIHSSEISGRWTEILSSISSENQKKKIMCDGNEALSLGAIHA